LNNSYSVETRTFLNYRVDFSLRHRKPTRASVVVVFMSLVSSQARCPALLNPLSGSKQPHTATAFHGSAATIVAALAVETHHYAQTPKEVF
jgi:hypothetical protein